MRKVPFPNTYISQQIDFSIQWQQLSNPKQRYVIWSSYNYPMYSSIFNLSDCYLYSASSQMWTPTMKRIPPCPKNTRYKVSPHSNSSRKVRVNPSRTKVDAH